MVQKRPATLPGRWFEWKLVISADKKKRASSIKINHIYQALVGAISVSPNCESNWDDKGINPPPRGWSEVWKQFHGLLGTPRDIKTRFKFLHRGLYTAHRREKLSLQQLLIPRQVIDATRALPNSSRHAYSPYRK